MRGCGNLRLLVSVRKFGFKLFWFKLAKRRIVADVAGLLRLYLRVGPRPLCLL